MYFPMLRAGAARSRLERFAPPWLHAGMLALPLFFFTPSKEKRQQDIGENPAALCSPNAEDDFGEDD
jgi:hypothetical protein